MPRPEKDILQQPSKLEESRNNTYVQIIIYMLLHFRSPFRVTIIVRSDRLLFSLISVPFLNSWAPPLGTRFPFDGHVQNALLSSYHPIGHRCRRLSPIVFSEIEMSQFSILKQPERSRRPSFVTRGFCPKPFPPFSPAVWIPSSTGHITWLANAKLLYRKNWTSEQNLMCCDLAN